MKRRILLLITFLCIFSSVVLAQSGEMKRCTEEQLPLESRSNYIEQATEFLRTYYNQLMLNVGELVIQKEFVKKNMYSESNRYKPEFLFERSKDVNYLLPNQYLQELEKQFNGYDIDNIEITIDNVNINLKDFFLPNLISCYLIADYDLTFTYDSETLFKRRCRAYCLFPNAMAYINVKLMQVEPVKDVIAYNPQKKGNSQSTDINPLTDLKLSNNRLVNKRSVQGGNSALKGKPFDLDSAPNGVYAVTKDGKGLNIDDADENCIAVALIVNDAPVPQKFWIEKYEYLHPAYSSNLGTTTKIDTLYSWGGAGIDQTTIINRQATNPFGYRPSKLTMRLWHNYIGDTIKHHSAWRTGALADFNGKANSVEIRKILDNGSGNNVTPMGHLYAKINEFYFLAEYNGYKDWYIPSCGQLTLISLNVVKINVALKKIGGTPLLLTYWSSTECDKNRSWYVWMGLTIVKPIEKTCKSRVRFIRDID